MFCSAIKACDKYVVCMGWEERKERERLTARSIHAVADVVVVDIGIVAVVAVEGAGGQLVELVGVLEGSRGGRVRDGKAGAVGTHRCRMWV